ncbi:hypothetical protein PAMA_004340 [Pampus argenteus]
MLTAFFEQIGGKLVSKHRCFGAALPTLSGTTTNKSSYAWLNESPPLPTPPPPPPPTPPPPLSVVANLFASSYSPLDAKPSFWRVPHVPPKSNVRHRRAPQLLTHTLQRNKQIKVRTADYFFEVMAFAVVMTSGRANKLMVFEFSLSKPN